MVPHATWYSGNLNKLTESKRIQARFLCGGETAAATAAAAEEEEAQKGQEQREDEEIDEEKGEEREEAYVYASNDCKTGTPTRARDASAVFIYFFLTLEDNYS